MAYGASKDLLRKTASDKVMSDKAFAVVSNPRHDEYKHGLTSMVYKFFDKSRDTTTHAKAGII